MLNFIKKHRKYLCISLICLLIGILISLSIKSYLVLKNVPKDNKNQTLIEVIDRLENDTSELEKQVEEMRNLVTTTGKEQGTDLEYINKIKKDMDDLMQVSQQTELSGVGIIITLDDNNSGAEATKLSDPKNYYPENFIIHDTDLRYLLNDIAYLADGISINGQRITTMSDIRCVGTVIMVNSTRVAPPYEISLIGSAPMLEAALLESNQYNYLKNKNMPIKVVKNESLVLPPYTGTILMNYAQPANTK